jgi:hypothetical protein
MMNIEKAQIGEITRRFELKAYIAINASCWQGQTLALRGLDFPGFRSKKGQALREHLLKVIRSVPFLAVKKYGKDAFVRHSVDVFYLPADRQVVFGENDPVKVAEQGRCLNQELLDLGLAKPYDENKRKIDFSKRSFKMYDEQIDLVTGNFKAEVCMYINDCKQYLRAASERKPVNMEKGEFDPTDEEFLIIYGLKELKDMCMQQARRARLDWQGN